MSVPVRVSRLSDEARARPKSITRTRIPTPSSRVTMMFSGLTSRCTTPRAWL